MSLRPSICCLAFLAGALACSKKEPKADEAAAAKQGQSELAANAAPKQTSVGRTHLPEGCDVVATIDWQRFRKMQAVKQDLEKEIADLNEKPDPEAKRAAEFLKKADIDLLEDPGDIALCLWQLDRLEQDGTPGFVAVVGGKFRPGAAIEALDTVTERLKALVQRAGAAATGKKAEEQEIVQIAGVKAIRDKQSGVIVAQATNGAFVIANDQPKLEKALKPGSAHGAYKLSAEPVGVALTRSAKGFVTQALSDSPFAAATQSFAGAHMGFDDRFLRMEAHFDVDKDAASFKQGLDALLASAPPGTAEGAKIQVDGKVVSIEVPLPEEAMGGMLQQLPGAAPPRPSAPPPPSPKP